MLALLSLVLVLVIEPRLLRTAWLLRRAYTTISVVHSAGLLRRA